MDRPKYDQKPDQKPQTPAVELPSQRLEAVVAASLPPAPPSIHAVDPDSAVSDPKKVEDEEVKVAGNNDDKGNSADYKSSDAPLKAQWKH